MEPGLDSRATGSKASICIKCQRENDKDRLGPDLEVSKGRAGQFGFYGISNGEGRKVLQQKRNMMTEMFEEDEPGWDGLNGTRNGDRGEEECILRLLRTDIY